MKKFEESGVMHYETQFLCICLIEIQKATILSFFWIECTGDVKMSFDSSRRAESNCTTPNFRK
uniref:Candidate secreted effector n=1 Tax=Meloidogyne incognita TaxID=6306 RepID=A0A914N881_MELIC